MSLSTTLTTLKKMMASCTWGPAGRSLVVRAAAEEGTGASLLLWTQHPRCPMPSDYCLLPEVAFLPQFWQWLENRRWTPVRWPAARQGPGDHPIVALLFLALFFLEMVEPGSATQPGIWEGLQRILCKLKEQNWSKELNRKLLKCH